MTDVCRQTPKAQARREGSTYGHWIVCTAGLVTEQKMMSNLRRTCDPTTLYDLAFLAMVEDSWTRSALTQDQ